MDWPRVDDADLPKWRRLWADDLASGVPAGAGLKGRIAAFAKRKLRRLTVSSQQDLWERQRLYNMLIQHHLEARRELDTRLGQALDDAAERRTQASAHDYRLAELEKVHQQGLERIIEHHDTVFALLDHKLDLYRRQAVELRGQLVSLLEVARSGDAGALRHSVEEQEYVELEKRHRGTELEIAERIEPYLPFFDTPGEILDLGCGRGEALEIFRRHGLRARGVDSNAEMVALSREKGLEAVEGDLFEALASTPEGSLAGVVSFHVIEHLSGEAIERLVRLARRALAPRGVLVLETPSPLSVVVGARNFWLDPTHRRPVHPDSLKLTFEHAGFEQVERIDRQPFPPDDRLHEIPTAELPEPLRPLAQEVNRLRDQLDELLLGFQDYGMVGRKP